MPTFEQREGGYHSLWDKAAIVPSHVLDARRAAEIGMKYKSVYQDIEAATGIPWPFIVGVHFRESSFNFKTHLHCGDPLTARTMHVPRGRPITGQPPFTFRASAIDALTMVPHQLNRVKRWSVERFLYEWEKYNGWGYIGKTVSPYVFGGTAVYHGGMYVADHKFSSVKFDPRIGCAAILKELAILDPSISKWLSDREPSPPKDVILEQVENQTKKARVTRNVAGTTGSVGTGMTIVDKTAPGPSTHGLIAVGLPVAACVLIVVMAGAIAYTLKKQQTVPVQVNEKWA